MDVGGSNYGNNFTGAVWAIQGTCTNGPSVGKSRIPNQSHLLLDFFSHLVDFSGQKLAIFLTSFGMFTV
jgi:hypothetical protein